ncbi:Tn3 family transposase [Streptomyces sp. NPDC057638]|uniref:Tn3 family transposase n=1 Tax=Streptomyces sp. NPDC057638 TaxID=3346190 RepID=UPI00369E2CDF
MPAFRQLANNMLPNVDFPELLLEVADLTGMTSAFTHISGAYPSMEEFELSVCALLLSEACNVGLTPVVKPNVPALTRGRLVQVDQGYLRAETSRLTSPCPAVDLAITATERVEVDPSSGTARSTLENVSTFAAARVRRCRCRWTVTRPWRGRDGESAVGARTGGASVRACSADATALRPTGRSPPPTPLPARAPRKSPAAARRGGRPAGASRSTDCPAPAPGSLGRCAGRRARSLRFRRVCPSRPAGGRTSPVPPVLRRPGADC